MAITASDIQFTLSGGSANSNPSQSLGGEPSAQQIVGGINNLFDNISKTESEDGSIDYRCFYVFNNNGVDTLYDVAIFISAEIENGAYVELGVEQVTDIQRLTIEGTVTGGSIDMSYEGNTFSFNYDANLEVWGENLETALNALDDLSGVAVDTSIVGGTRFFEISFEGDDDNKFHDLLEIEDTSGLSGAFTIAVAKLTGGAPINSVSAQIENENQEPFGITFASYGSSNRLSIGTLRPLDSFPVWIRRTVLPATPAQASDGFTFRVSGSPIAS